MNTVSTTRITIADSHAVLIHGDSGAGALAAVADNSVDAAICDLPSGQGFMGAHWDTFADMRDTPTTATHRTRAQGRAFRTALRPLLAEVFRVLKPGGFVFAWSFTHRSYWTGDVLEDVGFDIKHGVVHVQAQGYPKGGRVDAALDAAAGVWPDTAQPGVSGRARVVLDVGGATGKARNGLKAHYMPAEPVTDQAQAWDGWNGTLKPAASELWWLAQKPIQPITSDALHAVTGWDWWHHRQAVKGRQLARWLARGYTPLPAVGPHGEPYVLHETRRALHAGVEHITVLHHAHGMTELTRRPYRRWHSSTIAASVLVNRVGALNIDACRVPGSGRYPSDLIFAHADGCQCVGTKRVRGSAPVHGDEPSAVFGGPVYRPKAARAPSRYVDADGMELVAHWQCVPACPVAQLDAQSGRSTSHAFVGHANGRVYGGAVPYSQRGYDDAGGVSRCFMVLPPNDAMPDSFVYMPKLPPRERWWWCATCRCAFQQPERARHIGHALTAHITQKRGDLIRYLTRLITPPGGTVLDPCMGSGTTAEAALSEGFSVIGVERERDYYALAVSRIAQIVPEVAAQKKYVHHE